jgi:hypothetical protein
VPEPDIPAECGKWTLPLLDAAEAAVLRLECLDYYCSGISIYVVPRRCGPYSSVIPRL